MSYHECPRCLALVAPANVTTDADWDVHRLNSGAVEMRREYLIECPVCDRAYLVTLARDERDRERVLKVEDAEQEEMTNDDRRSVGP